MSSVVICLLPILLLLAVGAISSRFADQNSGRLRRVVAGIAGLHLATSTLALCWCLFSVFSAQGSGEPLQLSVSESLLAPSVLLDGTSGLMLILVAFVGWVICRYSIRYLDGEAHQGQYFRWLGLTIGAVSLLAVSGDLLTLFVAWSLSSLGIHKLLTHYSERPAARKAAWTKFAISRVADAFLVAAGVLIFKEFGTLNLSELFAAVRPFNANGLPADSLLPSTGALLITGAALKTAQFPFHTWLPETLEAPTPVSALMHAGIVNAGGFLLIRLSPLLIWSPLAMTSLAVLGALTACFAALVMLTQTSIKKSLAWSTIAQMGFMMLQCGLGAFSAAMLHIIAHSLYKAHAFLNSGDVLNQSAATRGAVEVQATGTKAGFVTLGFSLTATLAIYGGITSLFGLDLAAKPGGFLLGLILCLGLTRWVWQLAMSRQSKVIPIGLITTALLGSVYAVSFLAVDAVITSSNRAFGVSGLALNTPINTGLVAGFIIIAFATLLSLETWLAINARETSHETPRWMQTAYVHASNGFYVDAILTRTARNANS